MGGMDPGMDEGPPVEEQPAEAQPEAPAAEAEQPPAESAPAEGGDQPPADMEGEKPPEWNIIIWIKIWIIFS